MGDLVAYRGPKVLVILLVHSSHSALVLPRNALLQTRRANAEHQHLEVLASVEKPIDKKPPAPAGFQPQLK